MTLTEYAQVGYWGNPNPHIYSSPAWYAHVFGQYLHGTGRNPPHDVRMGRGYSIRNRDMRFLIKEEGKSVSFERVL